MSGLTAIVSAYLLVAHGLPSTTYGHSEKNCGHPSAPVACAYGAITATGERFDPSIPTAALALPASVRIRKNTTVFMRVEGGKCHPIKVNDKMNHRYVGQRGFDLTPAAVELLTGSPAKPYWSSKVYLCSKGEK